MSIELTDSKRYELELDNCIAIILDANRRDKTISKIDLAKALNISTANADKLVAKMRTDNIIK
jgi:Mn-dependent DtxR family transcriptional regulator